MSARFRWMIVLSMTVLLAIAGALPAAAAPPAPLSGQALPVAGRPAKAGVPQRSASQRMTADAATVDATWTSLMAVNAQFDTDSVEFALTSDMDVSDFVLATYGLAAAEVAHGGPLDQDPDSDSSTDPLGEGFELWPFTITEDDLPRMTCVW